jgi:hypothetical protein
MNLTCWNIYSLVQFDGMQCKGRIEPLQLMLKGFTGDDKDILAKFVFYYTSVGVLYRMLLYFPILTVFLSHPTAKVKLLTKLSPHTTQSNNTTWACKHVCQNSPENGIHVTPVSI